MSQLDFHNNSENSSFKTPPDALGELKILTKLNDAYKIWHEYLTNLPRHTRLTIGIKIDNLFTDCIELSYLAGYSSRPTKFSTIEKLSARFDAMKFFIKLLWEMKSLDNKKYIHLSSPLAEIGRMVGAWLKTFKNLR